MRLGIASLFVFVLGLVRMQAASVPILAEAPFELRDGLIWVKVSAPGAGQPLNFMVDSGAQVSVINLGMAQRLGLETGALVTVQGVKSSISGFWPERFNGRLASMALPKDFLALDLRQLSQACGCGIDGLLGADFFRNRRVQIDFRERKIRLLGGEPQTQNTESIPLRQRSRGLLVKIQVNNGRPQAVRLDTGCASALQWVAPQTPRAGYSRQIAVGLTEVSIPTAKTSVQLGSSRFQDIPTGFQERQIFAGEAGLLGTPLLEHFSSITIDTLSKRLFLQR